MPLARLRTMTKAAAVVCLAMLLLVVWGYGRAVQRTLSAHPARAADGDGGPAAANDDGDVGPVVIRVQEKLPQGALDMSFKRHPAICYDTVPTLDSLRTQSGAGGHTVEITHAVCCDHSGASGSDQSQPAMPFSAAPKPLRIPLALAEAALASGDLAVDLDKLDLLRSLVFVTGSSADHYTESLVLVKSLQKFFPKHRILYWDLGLTSKQAASLQTLCGVTYRRFNASKYPPHVATLTTYAFKPLVIMESFSESYPILWWADSSIRFTSSRVEHVLALMKQRHGIVMYREPTHSVYSTTYRQMYDYVVTDAESLKWTTTVAGASFLVANTKELFSTVLFWFYACALDQRCIAPIMYPEKCIIPPGDYFWHCHRFDQSLMTILVANIWGFDSDDYRFPQDMFYLDRADGGDKSVSHCTPGAGR